MEKYQNNELQKLNLKFCSTSDPSTLKRTHPQVDSWDLKSSMLSKQILGILESIGLLSKLATHQWNKQINLNI